MELLGVIVQRARTAVRGFDAQVIADEITRDKAGTGTERAAIVKARLGRAVTASVECRVAAGLKRSALGREVDDSGTAQAVLRRQAACDQLHRGDHSRR